MRIEFRWAEGDSTRLPEHGSDLVRLGVDVIVTGTPVYTGARATSVTPIVFQPMPTRR